MAVKSKGLGLGTKAKKGGAATGQNNSFYGRRHSKEWKKQESLRKKGKKNPMFGRKHSKSTIQKIRQAAFQRYAK